MHDSEPTSSARADALDPDGIYRQIGVYVVSFQHLENQLFQLCWFLTEPAYSETGRRALAEKTYSWLVGETGRRVYDFLRSQGREESDFARHFHSHLHQCREVGRDRNRIVHSAYIHLEGGGELRGMVRSDMSKESGGGDVNFDQDYLTEQSFDAELRQLAEVAAKISFDLRQLIAWRR
jgi:hypothetical protein